MYKTVTSSVVVIPQLFFFFIQRINVIMCRLLLGRYIHINLLFFTQSVSFLTFFTKHLLQFPIQLSISFARRHLEFHFHTFILLHYTFCVLEPRTYVNRRNIILPISKTYSMLVYFIGCCCQWHWLFQIITHTQRQAKIFLHVFKR